MIQECIRIVRSALVVVLFLPASASAVSPTVTIELSTDAKEVEIGEPVAFELDAIVSDSNQESLAVWLYFWWPSHFPGDLAVTPHSGRAFHDSGPFSEHVSVSTALPFSSSPPVRLHLATVVVTPTSIGSVHPRIWANLGVRSETYYRTVDSNVLYHIDTARVLPKPVARYGTFLLSRVAYALLDLWPLTVLAFAFVLVRATSAPAGSTRVVFRQALAPLGILLVAALLPYDGSESSARIAEIAILALLVAHAAELVFLLRFRWSGPKLPLLANSAPFIYLSLVAAAISWELATRIPRAA